MKRHFLGWLAVAALGLSLEARPIQAAIVSMSALTGGQTIQSGDKIFSNFKYTPNGNMPSAGGVTVESIQNPAGDYGIRISGGFIDQPGGDASDALVTFDVSVAPGSGQAIKGTILQANPAVFGGSGLASVTETFLPTISNDKLVVYDFGNNDQQLLDSITFGQTYTTLPIQKDIILHATGASGAVTMSFVDQYFPQVPEPSGMVMLLGGLAAVNAFRRRKS